MQTPQTQCGHFEPNTDALNLTWTCQVKHPMSCVNHGHVELNMDGGPNDGTRFMDCGACRGG